METTGWDTDLKGFCLRVTAKGSKSGASLFLIGKALGQATARTTERYAHLSGDPLAELAASAATRIATKMGQPGS